MVRSLKKEFTQACNDFVYRNARHIVGRLSEDGDEVKHKETIMSGAYTVEMIVRRNHAPISKKDPDGIQTNIHDMIGGNQEPPTS